MSTEQINKFQEELDIPENVEVTYKSKMIQVTGPLGKTYKSFKKIPVDISLDGKKIFLKAVGTRNKNIAIMRTAKSIIRNLCEGVIDGYTIRPVISCPPLTDSKMYDLFSSISMPSYIAPMVVINPKNAAFNFKDWIQDCIFYLV